MKKRYLLLIILLVLIISLFIYLDTYYKSTSDVKEYLKNSETIKVKKDENGYLFDGPGEDNILVFYPGAKVEYTSYAPLMNNLAKEGIDTYIVKMPFNIAFFDKNAIKEVKNNYQYDNWYIGGHSLGGVVASSIANEYDIKSLILLASYATSRVECNVLSIYGTNDKVLNLKSYKKNIKNIPNNKEIKIDGGNHSYFGNYGEQKGDGKSTISRNEQQEQTIKEIVKFIQES